MKYCAIGLTLLLFFCGRLSYSQCNRLDFEEGVGRKLISPDLFNIVMDSEWMGCPKFPQGDLSLCGTIKSSSNEWDIDLPDGLLFTAFFEPKHYAMCKEVFTDPFFLESMASVPYPSPEAMQWFEMRNRSHTVMLQSKRDDSVQVSLDSLQRKMITVLYNIKSWTFCPEEQRWGSTVVHASFDKQNNIVVYNTACKARSSHDEDISTLALAYRLFFVCSHEVGHAIDRLAGFLSGHSDESKNNFERRANINGLIMTTAFSKLYRGMLLDYQEAIEKSEDKAPCDEYYLSEAVKKWGKVDAFLNKRLKEAKNLYRKKKGNELTFRTNSDWTLWGCLEYNELP